MISSEKIFSMLGNMVIFGVISAASGRGVDAQAASCNAGNQCDTGYYCDYTNSSSAIPSYTCKQCLQCGDLKREQPDTSCVKIFSECGACIKGYAYSLAGDVDPSCVKSDPAVPVYVWALTAVVLTLVVILVVALCVFKYPEKLKVLSATWTSIQRNGPEPSCPSVPPPYNPSYRRSWEYDNRGLPPDPAVMHGAVHLSVPPPPYTQADTEDANRPLMKSTLDPLPPDTRVTEGHQEGRVMNHPNYVRLPPDFDFDSLHPQSPAVPRQDDNNNTGHFEIDEHDNHVEAPVETPTPPPASENAQSLELATVTPRQVANRKSKSYENSNGAASAAQDDRPHDQNRDFVVHLQVLQLNDISLHLSKP